MADKKFINASEEGPGDLEGFILNRSANFYTDYSEADLRELGYNNSQLPFIKGELARRDLKLKAAPAPAALPAPAPAPAVE